MTRKTKSELNLLIKDLTYELASLIDDFRSENNDIESEDEAIVILDSLNWIQKMCLVVVGNDSHKH